MPNARVERWTFFDAVNHIIDVFENDAAGKPLRNAKRAVIDSHRRVPNTFPWNYFSRRVLITTSPPYSDGTVGYDHTGGASERLLTLTGGTLPAWAEDGQILISNVRYRIARRLSDTAATLTEQANPGQDIASGSTYELARAIYPLPVQGVSFSHMVELSTGYRIELVNDEMLLEYLQGNQASQRPYLATIRASGNRPGRMELEFSPPPSQQYSYDLFAKFRPLYLNLYEYSIGTITVASGDNTVTGTNTNFSSNMIGSVLRISENSSTIPTSSIGALIDGIDTLNPYAWQANIIDVPDPTTLVVDADAPKGFTGKKYIVSDPIDLEAGAMWDWFLALCEATYGRYQRVDNRDQASLDGRATRMMLEAQQADSRIKSMHSLANNMAYWDLADWATN
jgi:hypothetical protein